MTTSRFAPVILSVLVACAAWAGPDTGAHSPSQSAADLIREAARADIAFLAAGLVKERFDENDLSTLVRYPTDEIAVVNLTGAQIRSALERSAALYPSPTDSFLQVSNLDVTFSKSAQPDSRVTAVVVGSSKLDNGKTYRVAMPTTLARGGLGFFKIWDRNSIAETLSRVTLESVLAGKSAKDSPPRWHVTN